LRARANTLKSKDLIPFISQVHYYGLKAYLTLNSTIYNQDIKKAENYCKKQKML